MASPNSVRTTKQMPWTIPIALIAPFLAICEKKMMKPSHVITQLIREWVEKNS